VGLPQESAAIYISWLVGRMAEAGWEALESFTIITTEPNQLVRPIHNRMPVILQPEDEEQWLDASRTSFAKARSVLKPYPDELMDAHDFSPIVNSAKYDGPECIRPVSDDDIPRAGQLSLL
jgi:putative SOS response-associated peptidase YedK